MAKVALLNQKAENVGEIELNDAVFAIEPNNQAIFDMVLLQRASLRQGTHKVKGRSEVRGGGKKPWRQKGTGRARQGSTRAPQWVGGGTVFGPTPRSYKFKLNRKVRRLALRSALSQKLIDNEFTALNDLAFDSINLRIKCTLSSDNRLDQKFDDDNPKDLQQSLMVIFENSLINFKSSSMIKSFIFKLGTCR